MRTDLNSYPREKKDFLNLAIILVLYLKKITIIS